MAVSHNQQLTGYSITHLHTIMDVYANFLNCIHTVCCFPWGILGLRHYRHDQKSSNCTENPSPESSKSEIGEQPEECHLFTVLTESDC